MSRGLVLGRFITTKGLTDGLRSPLLSDRAINQARGPFVFGTRATHSIWSRHGIRLGDELECSGQSVGDLVAPLPGFSTPSFIINNRFRNHESALS